LSRNYAPKQEGRSPTKIILAYTQVTKIFNPVHKLSHSKNKTANHTHGRTDIIVNNTIIASFPQKAKAYIHRKVNS